MRRFLAFCFLLVFSGLQADAADGVQLQKTVYTMPYDGQPNNNQPIGDFCCTGHTAVINSQSGVPVGYIYFYDFRGGVNFGDGTSGADAIGLLVSGLTDARNPNSNRVKGSIWFSADELSRGVRSKRQNVGKLSFSVNVDQAPLRGGKIKMGQFSASVTVAVTDLVEILPGGSSSLTTNPTISTAQAREYISAIVANKRRREELERQCAQTGVCRSEQPLTDAEMFAELARWYGNTCNPTCNSDCTTLFQNLEVVQRADFAPPC